MEGLETLAAGSPPGARGQDVACRTAHPVAAWSSDPACAAPVIASSARADDLPCRLEAAEEWIDAADAMLHLAR